MAKPVDIKQLKTIVSIADHGSFQLAAMAMDMSVSNVSLQVKALEQTANDILFDRGSRPPKLTEFGHDFVFRARKLLVDWEKLDDSLHSGPRHGALKIGAVHTAVAGAVAKALGRLKKAQPELFLSLQTALTPQLVKKLQNQTLDCAVVTQPQTASIDLRFIPIAQEPLGVIAHKNAAGQTLEEILTQNPYLRFNRKATLAALIDNELKQRAIQVHSTMEITTLDAIESLVKNGLGVSVVPLGKNLSPLSKSLKVVPFSAPNVVRHLGLMVRDDCPKLHLVDSLVTELRKAYGTEHL